MSVRRRLLSRVVLAVCFLFSPDDSIFGQSEAPYAVTDVPVARDTSAILATLKDTMRENVEDHWAEIVREGADLAAARNRTGLYPNPSAQIYVNNLGQSLIPRELSADTLLSFRVVNDPLPYADALATGTVYVSTGLLSLLDNESQLAFALMHEAAHVVLAHHLQQAIIDEQAEKRAKRIKMIGGAAGALTGGLFGSSDVLSLSMFGYMGFRGGELGTEVAGRFRDRRYLRRFQLESDLYATKAILQRGFDAREAPTLMATIANILGRSGVSVALAFGNGVDLPYRIERVEYLLEDRFSTTVLSVLEQGGFRMSSPRFNRLMAEVKRDNGLLALGQDLFAIARKNLEESAALKTDDPITMYGLGLLHQWTARSEEGRGRAVAYLRRAMEFDELHHRFPRSYLMLAVELLDRNDPNFYSDAQAALKNFVVLYQRKTGGKLPPEIQYVYDGLERTGDSDWVAYEVSNTSTDVPYQLIGEPLEDRFQAVTEDSE